MTEKRYTMKPNNAYNVFDTKEYSPLDILDCCNCLNEQYDEIVRLKSEINGLKSELQIFKQDVNHSNLQTNKIFAENEKLKRDNHRLKIALKEIQQKTEIYLEMTSKGEDNQ